MTRWILITALCLFAVPAWTERAWADRAGTVKTVSGEAFLERGGEQLPAGVGDEVMVDDVIVTGADGAMGVTFDDNTRFAAGPDTRIAVESFRFNSDSMEGDFLANISQGTVTVDSGDIARGSADAMKVRTPSAILGVRGTRFALRVGAE